MISSAVTTQSSTACDTTIDGSGSESDWDDGRSVESYVIPETPTNSVISDGTVLDSWYDRENRRAARREHNAARSLPNVQLTSVVEAEETGVRIPESLVGEAGEEQELFTDLLRTSGIEPDTGRGRESLSIRSALPKPTSTTPDHDAKLNLAQHSRSWDSITGVSTDPSSEATGGTLNALVFDNKVDTKQQAWSSDLAIVPALEQESQVDRDTRILEQLGYSQVLGRDYGFWASFSVGYCAFGGLQAAALSTYITWSYGGPQMILCMWPILAVGIFFMICATAELVSAYPVAGAMSSWTWIMAKRGVGGERYWGWFMGGIILGYHVTTICSTVYFVGATMNQTMHMAVETYPKLDYVTSLFALAVLCLQAIVVSSKWGRNPRLWITGGLFTFVVWLGICIALLAKRPSFPPSRALSNAPYTSSTGWDNRAMLYIFGVARVGVRGVGDACAHLAEETRNPSRTVPLAMLTSYTASISCGYILIWVILISVDPSWVEDIMTHEFPPGHIFQKVLGERAAVTVLSLLIIVLSFQSLVTLQASSRYLWAISRDQSIPFSKVFYKVSKNKLPVAATWLLVGLASPIIAVLWSDPRIVPSVLYSAAGVFWTFAFSIPPLLTLLARADLSLEDRSTWSLRRLSKPIFAFTPVMGTFVGLLVCLPAARPITILTISWGPLTLTSALLLSFVTWKLYGEKHYIGPIRSITRWTAGAELDLRQALDRTSQRPTQEVESGSTRSDSGGSDLIAISRETERLRLRVL